MKKIRCGTRGSLLALAQTGLVLEAFHYLYPDVEIERHEVKTLGDRKQGTKLASHSDKKDWVYDLEMALLNHQIDIAVHSGKDIPYLIEPGTSLIPVLKRANPFDAFIGRKMGSERVQFTDLPLGSVVGTASLRRKAFLLQMRPDLIIVEHRGNVPTRLQKMEERADMQGIVLASAGLDRLRVEGLKYEAFSQEQMLPALNQGTLVVQIREEDQEVRRMIESLVHRDTHAAWLAERSVAEILKGDCKSAIGIFAKCKENVLDLTSIVMLPDGTHFVKAKSEGQLEEAFELGRQVGHQLIDLGANEIIEKSRLI